MRRENADKWAGLTLIGLLVITFAFKGTVHDFVKYSKYVLLYDFDWDVRSEIRLQRNE